MSFGQRFIETLKIIKHPDVDKLNPASFDWMIDDPKVSRFVEDFCSNVTEENVLTEEELKEYEEMMADNSIDLNVLEKMVELQGDDLPKEEKQEQIEDLEIELANTERYVRELEHQRDVLNMHKLELVQEAEAYEAHEKELQKDEQKMKSEILSNFISELKVAVDSGVQVVSDIRDTLKGPASKSVDIPNAMFLRNLEPYFSSELELLEDVRCHIKNILTKFTMKLSTGECPDDFIPLPVFEEMQKKTLTEAVWLKNKIIKLEDQCVQAELEEEKLEAQKKFLEEWEANGGVASYENVPKEEYNLKLKRAQETAKEMEIVQKRLKEKVGKNIRDYVGDMLNQVVNDCCKRKCAYYRAFIEVLQKPIDALLEQRGRLELLNNILIYEGKKMDDILDHIRRFREEVSSEDAEIEEVKKIVEEKKNEPIKPNCVEEGSLLYAVNKVLSSDSDPELVYLTEEDVLEKIRKKSEEKDRLLEESEKLLKDTMEWVSVIEKKKDEMKDFFYGKKSKDHKHPCNVLEDLGFQLHKVGERAQSLDETLLKEMNNFQKKKKLIETNSRLEKSRKLFVYYVTDKKKYQQCKEELNELEKNAS